MTTTLTQLLDRLAELRPEYCQKIVGSDYNLTDGSRMQRYSDLSSEWRISKDLDLLSKLKGAIERAIEAEMEKAVCDWFGYASGCNHESGYWAWIDGVRHGTVERLNQPSQAIALLGCLVSVLERESA